MPTRNIVDRLKGGEVLLMDGGTGSELQRRGVDVLKGATGVLKAWSATSNIENADVVQQVHQDYLRVGAEIIISNNFWTIPTAMERIGMRDQWKDYATAAAENAVKARAAGNPDAYVAGGIAAPTLHVRTGKAMPDIDQMGEEAFKRDYVEHAELLAEAGADVILAEYVGYIVDCVAAVDACAEAGLPVFLGVRHIDRDGGMQYGESLEGRQRSERTPRGRRTDHVQQPGGDNGRAPNLGRCIRRSGRGLPEHRLQPDRTAGQQARPDQSAS